MHLRIVASPWNLPMSTHKVLFWYPRGPKYGICYESDPIHNGCVGTTPHTIFRQIILPSNISVSPETTVLRGCFSRQDPRSETGITSPCSPLKIPPFRVDQNSEIKTFQQISPNLCFTSMAHWPFCILKNQSVGALQCPIDLSVFLRTKDGTLIAMVGPLKFLCPVLPWPINPNLLSSEDESRQIPRSGPVTSSSKSLLQVQH